ncbi:hypothetical protein Tco_1105197 [Tanacetum coccineum]
MEQRMFAQLGYRKKKWGMRMNEGLWPLFILENHLVLDVILGQEVAAAGFSYKGGDVEIQATMEFGNEQMMKALQVTDTVCRSFLVVGLLFLQFLVLSCCASLTLVGGQCKGPIDSRCIFTQGKRFPIYPIVASISPEGFFASDLLLISTRSLFLLGLPALAIDADCAFRAEEMPSLTSFWMATKVMAGVS